MNKPTYLDYNATTPVYPDIADVMRDALTLPLNASSVHSFGRHAKKQLEDARKSIAESISAWPNEIIFTASGTEANVTALRGIKGRRIAVSAIEHSSVLKAVVDPTLIPVDEHGIVKLDALDTLLADGQPTLVSVMLANNETGVIQPIKDISIICKKHNALLHCDAVQALGKIAFDFTGLGVDMMTLSAHKCGGPLGAAALIARRDPACFRLADRRRARARTQGRDRKPSSHHRLCHGGRKSWKPNAYAKTAQLAGCA
jgi:cysteine desulfurase